MLTNEQKKAILNDRIKESEGLLMENPDDIDLLLRINALKEIDASIQYE